MSRTPTAITDGNITRFLLAHPGEDFTVRGLASQFRASENSVRVLIRRLRKEGWGVIEDRVSHEVYYRFAPPQQTDQNLKAIQAEK